MKIKLFYACLLFLFMGFLPKAGYTASFSELTLDSEVSRITLFSRQKYEDYEKATFSFVHGVRDDPGYKITRNDWDIQFGNGGDFFDVYMVVDDRSRIRDLGCIDWMEISIENIPPLSAYPMPIEEPPIKVVVGHMYLAHIADVGTDIYVLLRVEALIPGDQCIISWKIISNLSSPTQDPLVPKVKLLCRQKYHDYEKATFSFEHGIRDDPDYKITRNDWDLQYGNPCDSFSVNMVVDDRSRIRDLGTLDWTELAEDKIPYLPALAQRITGREPNVNTIVGHMYIVHTVDSDTDLTALFRVEELSPGVEVVISWKILSLFSSSKTVKGRGPDLAFPTLDTAVPQKTLLSLIKHRDYEKATFSFEHGIRDDPGFKITKNDWDIVFGAGSDQFDVTMVVDDRSRIKDLGQIDWPELLKEMILPLPAHSSPAMEPGVKAIPGHMYLVHTVDSNTDLYALFRVEALKPDDRCTISWKVLSKVE